MKARVGDTGGGKTRRGSSRKEGAGRRRCWESSMKGGQGASREASPRDLFPEKN